MLKNKSLILVVMTLVCALMFTACGKKEDTNANNAANNSTEEKAPDEENKKKQEMQKLQLQEKMQDLKNFQLVMIILKDL